MQRDDNKNLLLAITLSVIVMVGWNYFYGAPKLEQQKQAAQITQSGGANTVPGAPAAPGTTPAIVTPGGTVPAQSGVATPLTREAALALAPRVRVETPSLTGSISLIGGRIDDLSLNNFREAVSKTSPRIVLFAPLGSKDSYYADFGWVAAAGQTISLPNAETRWQASGDVLKPGAPITLSYNNGQGLTFTRTIAVDDKYLFTITDGVKNNGSAPVALSSYGRVSRHGTPATLGFFILHEGMIGYLDDKLQELTLADLVKAKAKAFPKSNGGWLGMTEKYWAAALIPPQNTTFSAAFGVNGTNPVYEAAAISEAAPLAAGESREAVMQLFAGAKEVNVINGYGEALKAKNFDLMIDWGWFYFITKPMFALMHFVNALVGNFGITILIVTVIIKAIFFPLANKSYASMAKMKSAQPQMLEIQKRFADDKMKQQQAMMELYKKEKINPVAGCLPVLIQIPVFFALYKVLFVTLEMRHAPFFGWIQDLAAPDPTNIFNLFGLLPFTPPSILHLGIWPIIMGITMWLQMKMNPEPTDPVQKAVFAWMPLMFTFMLGSFPAGLVIYWAWNNLLSITQQYVIMKKLGTKIELWDNLRSLFKKA